MNYNRQKKLVNILEKGYASLLEIQCKIYLFFVNNHFTSNFVIPTVPCTIVIEGTLTNKAKKYI